VARLQLYIRQEEDGGQVRSAGSYSAGSSRQAVLRQAVLGSRSIELETATSVQHRGSHLLGSSVAVGSHLQCGIVTCWQPAALN
jgi:hypothetical protein